MDMLRREGKLPVIPLLGAPGIALSKTTLKENLTDPETQYRTISMILERFQPDGIFPFMDLSVEAEALGLKIEFPENEPPSVREHPIKDEGALDNLIRGWRGPAGRMKVFLDVVRRMRDFPVLKGGYVIGPFTLAGELMGVESLLLNLVEKPDLVKKLLLFTTQVIKEYADDLFTAGADLVAILDPTSVALSPRLYEEFSLPTIRELTESLPKPFVLHICGNTNSLIPSMIKVKVVGLSLDSLVNLKSISPIVPKDIAIIGNIDPVMLLQSTPERIEEATRKLVEEMKGVENFILSSGCDIPVGTPLENIDAFMRAGRKASSKE